MIKIHVRAYDSEHARERVREIVPHAGKQREGDLMSAVGMRSVRAGRTCGTSRRRSCERARKETSPRCSLGGAVSVRSGRARHQQRDRVHTRAR